MVQSLEVEILYWPANYPDLNIIENVWVQMARTVYAGEKKYECVAELESAVRKA